MSDDETATQKLAKVMAAVEARRNDPEHTNASRAAHYDADIDACFETNRYLFALIGSLQKALKDQREAFEKKLAMMTPNRAERRRGN